MYGEALKVCSEIIISITDKKDSLLHKAKLLKGKAAFYIYQPKLEYLMENRTRISIEEARHLEEECFTYMKESIALLGTAHDYGYLDIDDDKGSQLLDWAMMDCIRETNRLNQCKRCLLCRQSKDLCRSHVFPESAIKQRLSSQQSISKSLFAFGPHEYDLKSAGECWLWMLCKRCELIMTQTAEEDFLLQFPRESNVQDFKYDSWLFNYCCVIIFRTTALVKFPRSFNDDEIYGAFLYCRKHLLPLPVKVNGVQVKLTETEKHWIGQYSKWACKELEPYLFLIPDPFELVSTAWVSPHRLSDGVNDYSGISHFFVAICNNIAILLKFKPSTHCPLPDEYKIYSKGGIYKIQNEQQLEKVPKGFWMVHDRIANKKNKSFTEVLKHIKPAAEKFIKQHILPKSSLFHDTNITKAPSDKFVLSLLPSDIQIVRNYGTGDTIQKQIRLPPGHQIVLHQTIGKDDSYTSCLIVMDSSKPGLSDMPYVLLIHKGTNFLYLDGAYISDVNGKVHIDKFLLINHALCQFYRSYYSAEVLMKDFVLHTLLKDGFASLKHFLHHWRTRQPIKADDTISLGRKCSKGGCWYCYDLCYCCMSQAFPFSAKNETSPLRFCSEKCKILFCGHPEKILSTFVINHTDEIGKGKVIGTSVLDILKLVRMKGDAYNTVEFISLCLGDGSEGLPKSQPYILWQVRNVDGQFFLNFNINITETCLPLEPLWISSVENSDYLAVQIEKALALESYLNTHLTLAVHSLHYDSLISYLAPFKSAISSNPCLTSGNGINSSGLQVDNVVQVVVKTLSEGMKKKPCILFHAIDLDGFPYLKNPPKSTEVDDVITFEYKLPKVGKHNVFIYCNGRKTPDSPFLVSVTNVSLIKLSPLPSNIKVNMPVLITIKTEGAGEGQPNCTVEKLETDSDLLVVAETKVVAKEENVFEVKVIPLTAGQLLLKFKFDKILIPNGCFEINVD